MSDCDAAPRPWADALLTAELLAIAPCALGGVLLRAWPGPPRDRFCAWLRELLPAAAPLLRLPLHITQDRLLGGLSLAATLRAGRVVVEQGLLSRAHGGIVVAAMAERLEPQVTAHLCAALDRGELLLERDGITAAVACRLGVVALDEGLDEERVPAALRDRLAAQPWVAGLDGPSVIWTPHRRVHLGVAVDVVGRWLGERRWRDREGRPRLLPRGPQGAATPPCPPPPAAAAASASPSAPSASCWPRPSAAAR